MTTMPAPLTGAMLRPDAHTLRLAAMTEAFARLTAALPLPDAPIWQSPAMMAMLALPMGATP